MKKKLVIFIILVVIFSDEIVERESYEKICKMNSLCIL